MCVWKQCNKHYLEKTLGRKRWMRINFVLKEFTVHQIIFMGLNCLFLPSLLSYNWKLYRKDFRESQLQIQRSKRQRIWDHLECIPEDVTSHGTFFEANNSIHCSEFLIRQLTKSGYLIRQLVAFILITYTSF